MYFFFFFLFLTGVGHVKNPSVSALWRWQNLPQVRHKGKEKSSCGPFTSIDSVGEDVTIAFCPLPHVCCLKTASLQRWLSCWDSLPAETALLLGLPKPASFNSMLEPHNPVQLYIINTLSFQGAVAFPFRSPHHPVSASFCPCVSVPFLHSLPAEEGMAICTEAFDKVTLFQYQVVFHCTVLMWHNWFSFTCYKPIPSRLWLLQNTALLSPCVIIYFNFSLTIDNNEMTGWLGQAVHTCLV